MSGTWTGSRAAAARPMTPSPFWNRRRRASAPRLPLVVRCARPQPELLGGLVVLVDRAAVGPGELVRAGRRSSVSTVSRSSVELTRPADLAQRRELLHRARQVRGSGPRSSLNSRTFSIAMTAWSAKVWTSSICFSEKGPARHPPDDDDADQVALAEHGHPQDVRKPPSLDAPALSVFRVVPAISGIWTTRARGSPGPATGRVWAHRVHVSRDSHDSAVKL